MDMENSKKLRANHGLELVVGDDIVSSIGLQLALLTAVNLGAKCFAGNVRIYMSLLASESPCLVKTNGVDRLGDALRNLGGTVSEYDAPLLGRHLILGNAVETKQAIRITYDGWLICVGPAQETQRLPEREYCSLASIAAAAIAIGEIFADFSHINIAASRRVVTFSLWRPDLHLGDEEALGEEINELPQKLAVFGLGHLGQAYLWALSSLQYQYPENVQILLCDDDEIEEANVETGALLTPQGIGKLKTRYVANWLEQRGFRTRLIERRVDENFKATEAEPKIALSGFDNNEARQWLSKSGFGAIFDSGLGGEAHNFDTVAFHAWPNSRDSENIWVTQTPQEKEEAADRLKEKVRVHEGYKKMNQEECGRLLLAGKSVAVPFVGAVAACIVLAEMIKTINGGPVFSDIKIQICSLDVKNFCKLERLEALPIRGIPTEVVKR